MTYDNTNVIEDSMAPHRSAIPPLIPRLLAFAGGVLCTGEALADPWEWYFPPANTAIARQIVSLHDFIFWICVVIFVGVFGTMFYALFKHRKSVGHQAAQFHENTLVEVV